jgi:hypothetical protein
MNFAERMGAKGAKGREKSGNCNQPSNLKAFRHRDPQVSDDENVSKNVFIKLNEGFEGPFLISAAATAQSV